MTETKHPDLFALTGHGEAYLERVQDLNSHTLDDLEEAILIRRLELMAERLQAHGFIVCRARLRREGNTYFRYLSVGHESADAPAEWATLAECRRLIDTVRNLPAAEAFARWAPTVTPLEQEAYTREEAARDTREARRELQRQLDAGEIDAAAYHDLLPTTTFMDLAPAEGEAGS